MNEIYTDSILTFVFTNDGKIIVRKNREGKYDTLPLLFMGYREKDCKIDYEDSVWIMNNENEYKERIATFLAYHLRNSRKAIIDGWFVGNSNILLDVGELHEKIAGHQIEEMKIMQTPSFIRVNRELYDEGIHLNNQHIINRMETRYIVLPDGEDMNQFPELEEKNLDDFKKDIPLLSDRMVLGITGKGGRIMESFVSQLNSFTKNFK